MRITVPILMICSTLAMEAQEVKFSQSNLYADHAVAAMLRSFIIPRVKLEKASAPEVEEFLEKAIKDYLLQVEEKKLEIPIHIVGIEGGVINVVGNQISAYDIILKISKDNGLKLSIRNGGVYLESEKSK